MTSDLVLQPHLIIAYALLSWSVALLVSCYDGAAVDAVNDIEWWGGWFRDGN